jgi:hypothetical protein
MKKGLFSCLSYTLVFAFVILFVSCRKNKECTGIITVVYKDAASNNALKPVSGATVQIKFADLDEKQTTDAEGKAVFVLKLPANPDVFITSAKGNAKSNIKLEPGETTEKTVEVQ